MAGLIETIKFAGVLIFAIPAALAGLEFLLVRGQTLVGVGLLGLAVGLLVLQRYLTTPGDLPGIAAKRAVGSMTDDETPDDDRP
ncbi:DUF7533 family protein [Natronolimnobius baerhuensis]|uniref:Uncharacterized protein n=1 Tax=Natronolimnobius baerhuensis TaxID=253108 RepID=A0A202EAI7_9EURY|nr:hypothetical protein [Natronolimnobius baerhuensis]OVE85262.1 hypothetical protein B2G88_00055 [Natronolimnobius baerhuensis]